eukprot:comp8952_c0_seq1/m.4142 comp8952_c0_seq1/g.4142  ORF comp8952_c0_seq1/g.4142 comp8952_c0_seq1/m.4142 type:complete len:377 (-) comp8952_c0_seq1:313-1443(-)
MNSTMSRFIGAALAVSSAFIPSALGATGDFLLTNGQEITVDVPANTTFTFLLEQFFSHQLALGGAVISILPCAVGKQSYINDLVVEWVPESTSSRQNKTYSFDVTTEGRPICFARGYNVSVGQCAYREATDNPHQLQFDKYSPSPYTSPEADNTQALFVNSTSNSIRIRTISGQPIAFSIIAYLTLANTTKTDNETSPYWSVQTLPPFQNFSRQDLRSNANQVVTWNNTTPSYLVKVTVENVNEFCANNPQQCNLQVYTVQVANGSDAARQRSLPNGLMRTRNWCGVRSTLFNDVSSATIKYDKEMVNGTVLIGDLNGPQEVFVFVSLGGSDGKLSTQTMVGPMSNTFVWFQNSGSSLKASWHVFIAALLVVLVAV